MTIWIDAQLSPALAGWLERKFGVECAHTRELGLVEASDSRIFEAAGAGSAVVMTKDRDFVDLVNERNHPKRASDLRNPMG